MTVPTALLAVIVAVVVTPVVVEVVMEVELIDDARLAAGWCCFSCRSCSGDVTTGCSISLALSERCRCCAEACAVRCADCCRELAGWCRRCHCACCCPY